MNHDATHCFDYNPDECPKDCYRAQLTEDLRQIKYPWPVSFSNLKGTDMCPLTVTNIEKNLCRKLDIVEK